MVFADAYRPQEVLRARGADFGGTLSNIADMRRALSSPSRRWRTGGLLVSGYIVLDARSYARVSRVREGYAVGMGASFEVLSCAAVIFPPAALLLILLVASRKGNT